MAHDWKMGQERPARPDRLSELADEINTSQNQKNDSKPKNLVRPIKPNNPVRDEYRQTLETLAPVIPTANTYLSIMDISENMSAKTAREQAALTNFKSKIRLIRSILTDKGIPEDRQNEIIREMQSSIGAKAFKGDITTEQDVTNEVNNAINNTVNSTNDFNKTLAATSQVAQTGLNAAKKVGEFLSQPSNVDKPDELTQETPNSNTPINNNPETPATPVIGENPEMQKETVPESKPETSPSSVNEVTQQMEEEPERPYFVRNNGVPIYSNDGYSIPGRLKDYSYSMINGNRDAIHAPGEINETNSVQINPSKKTTQMQKQPVQQQEQPVEEPDRNYVVANNSVPYYENTPGAGIDAHSPDRRDYSYGYENGERRIVNSPGEINESNSTISEPSIRPVDRGRFDYIRNNGWGSNSSILTRMGYSQDEIRRILDSSGAVRPEYFSY